MTHHVENQGWTEIPCSEWMGQHYGYTAAKVLSRKGTWIYPKLECQTLDGQILQVGVEFCRRPSDADVLRFRQRELEKSAHSQVTQ